jgi:mono/diheme cytochrome c family protein
MRSFSLRILVFAAATILVACNQHIDKIAPTTPPEKPVAEWELNYQTLQERIFEPHCTRCHSVGGRAASVLFEPYETLIADTHKRWEAPAATSKIVRTLTRQDKFRMPPPSENDALSADELDFIERWIDAGKPQF